MRERVTFARGRTSIQSDPALGTEIDLRLPRVDGEAHQARAGVLEFEVADCSNQLPSEFPTDFIIGARRYCRPSHSFGAASSCDTNKRPEHAALIAGTRSLFIRDLIT